MRSAHAKGIAEVTVDNTASGLDILGTVSSQQHSSQPVDSKDSLSLIARAIVDSMQPVDPLWYLARLEAARVSGWELTTAQVRELIGVTPTCKKGKKTFRRGSFVFVKSGKIGSQTSWKVNKVTDDGYKV